jgi:ribosomal protein S21
MTNEELELALKEVEEKLAKYGPDDKLKGQEWRQKMQLKRERDLLENIQKDKAKGNYSQEAKHTVHYNLIRGDQHMNPVFRYLMRMKLRSQLWM